VIDQNAEFDIKPRKKIKIEDKMEYKNA
jgi:hypothetical protein